MENLTAGRRWAALLALALGGFGLGLTEFVAMGLLPDLARDLLPAAYARSAPDAVATAGWMITIYALGVVVGAPTIAALTARMPRRRLVLGLLALFLLGTVASALAPTFGLVLTGRFVAALAHGAYFGAAGLLAASMLGPGSQARGFAVVLSGLTAANVFGVPLITSLGQAAGWRMAYLAVAGVFALTLLFVLFTVPEVAPAADGSPRAELGAFRSPQVWLAAAVAAVGFGGFFAVNSYIAPVTTHVTGLPESYVPWVLAVMGIGMTVGNALGGVAADRNLRRSILLGFAAMIATVALFGVVARNPIGLFAAVFLVGAAALFIGPALQARLIAVAPRAQLMGAAVNQSASNIANSAGAALGGITIAAGWGYLSAAWIGVLLAATGLLLAVLSFRLDRRDPVTDEATKLEPAAA
ncbi:MFS transporter [Paractinoplanes abujensis]|uniref:DHA1 family inner membrane transport protein n=1 Tax=Paractinoplanes abujensis TaxID=882441 RepID=A0A7W7CW24_9ACTN|nr:MFS transporter [Actinoplanes abujensis]MBB4695698.1 DHA1 family inner membrane transport protein [Actinoplanes abujensis]GID23283.1 MFS transporter [Actinoplanes abujensis]